MTSSWQLETWVKPFFWIRVFIYLAFLDQMTQTNKSSPCHWSSNSCLSTFPWAFSSCIWANLLIFCTSLQIPVSSHVHLYMNKTHPALSNFELHHSTSTLHENSFLQESNDVSILIQAEDFLATALLNLYTQLQPWPLIIFKHNQSSMNQTCNSRATPMFLSELYTLSLVYKKTWNLS